jgi:hypothetical protein
MDLRWHGLRRRYLSRRLSHWQSGIRECTLHPRPLFAGGGPEEGGWGGGTGSGADPESYRRGRSVAPPGGCVDVAFPGKATQMTRFLFLGVMMAMLASEQEAERIASLIRNGRFAEAKEAAKARLRADLSPSDQARFLYLSGAAGRSLGEFAEARTALRSAATVCEKIGNEEALRTQILVSIGAAEVELGANAEAERTLLRARRLFGQRTGRDASYHSTIARELGYV